MSLTYTSWQSAITTLMVTTNTDPNYILIEPDIIDYAEQRIYRELNFLTTVVRDSSANVSANARIFTLPSSVGTFRVVNAVNVVTPVGSTTANGIRNPVIAASRDLVDFLWPSETAASATTVPQYFSMLTDQTIVFGPPPGSAFNVEIVGTIRPTPLSSGNATTYLTTYFPDLFVAASMIFASGYQKNFGRQADDPQQSQSWESQYQLLKSSADTESARQKWQAASWTSQQSYPQAVPQRG